MRVTKSRQMTKILLQSKIWSVVKWHQNYRFLLKTHKFSINRNMSRNFVLHLSRVLSKHDLRITPPFCRLHGDNVNILYNILLTPLFHYILMKPLHSLLNVMVNSYTLIHSTSWTDLFNSPSFCGLCWVFKLRHSYRNCHMIDRMPWVDKPWHINLHPPGISKIRWSIAFRRDKRRFIIIQETAYTSPGIYNRPQGRKQDRS
jgi:hypothetical protein